MGWGGCRADREHGGFSFNLKFFFLGGGVGGVGGSGCPHHDLCSAEAAQKTSLFPCISWSLLWGLPPVMSQLSSSDVTAFQNKSTKTKTTPEVTVVVYKCWCPNVIIHFLHFPTH